MNIFKKQKETDDTTTETSDVMPEPIAPPEEWVWVDGYKGTDKDMRCRDFQYELGKQYDMTEGQTIQVCSSGFHLCLNLEDVFDYYCIESNNRFFKVKALVRKSDRDQYGRRRLHFMNNSFIQQFDNNKLAAKSIILLEELTIDEICKPTKACDLPQEYKQRAIAVGVNQAIIHYQTDTLINDGYSMPFASYLVEKAKFNIAHALGSQKDLSMDMKVLGILKENAL